VVTGRRGSIRQEPSSGTWSYTVDVTPLGEKRRQIRKRGFPTRRAAQSALTKVLRDLDTGAHVDPSRLTLADYIEQEWLPNARMRLRPSTLHSYQRNLRIHVVPALGATPLQRITGTQLTALYAHLLDDGLADRSKARDGSTGLSVRTVRYIHTIIGSILKSAVKARLLNHNPADQAEPPRLSAAADGTRAAKTWTVGELAAFLDATRGTREHALWHLLATTGLRRGEALGLGWANVDLDAARITIVRTLIDIHDTDDDRPVWSDPKTAAGRRSVALDPGTVVILRAQRALRVQDRLVIGSTGSADVDDLVFTRADGRPYHPERLSRAFKTRVRAAGLPDIRLHDLRHTWATLALQAGIPAKIVQDRLGHSTVAITLNIYSHVTPQLQSDAASAVAAMISRGRV
jgi:integrase